MLVFWEGGGISVRVWDGFYSLKLELIPIPDTNTPKKKKVGEK